MFYSWQNVRSQELERQKKWDKRFLALAEHIAQWSKDPSTKCATVIVRPDHTIASVGYNGFPKAIADKDTWLNDRPEKYKRVIHGEMNAILNARERLDGYTLYTHPGPCSCERCTVHIIQAGIKRIVGYANEALVEKTKMSGQSEHSYDLTYELYREADVKVKIYDNE